MIKGTKAGIVKAINTAYQNEYINAKQGVEMLCAALPEYKPGSPIVREVGTVFFLDRRLAVHYLRSDNTYGIRDLFSDLFDSAN